MSRQRYTRRPGTPIIAVQLNLETIGFIYQKWGGPQECKQGDWLVLNGEETYTIDKETFAATYEEVGPGLFEKTGSVWAEVATDNGSIETKEGRTEYYTGEYLVSNNEDGTDAYSIEAEKFKSLYQEV